MTFLSCIRSVSLHHSAVTHTSLSGTADLKALVDALDDDGSGTLSIDELCDFIEVVVVVRRKKGEK